MRPPSPPMALPTSHRSRSRSPLRRHRSPRDRDTRCHIRDREKDRDRDRYCDHYHGCRSNSSRERPLQSRCIGIFGLSSRTTASDIRRIFNRFGHIDDVILVMDNRTRRSRGYCFVYFESIKAAVEAVDASVDLRIHSRYVRVDFSMTNRPRSPIGHRHKNDFPRSRYSRDRSRSPYY